MAATAFVRARIDETLKDEAAAVLAEPALLTVIKACGVAYLLWMAFKLSRSGQMSTAPMYIGDQTLIESVWRTLTTPGLRAVVSYGEPQSPAGRERREWAAGLREAVGALRTGEVVGR